MRGPSPALLLSLISISLLSPLVLAHGYLSHPPARQAGPATLAACGKPITDAILRDNTSHIEGLPELSLQSSSGYNSSVCNLWLCRGIQFGDNEGEGRVQTWRAGQTVGLKVKITIPHDGSANVSIVDTRRNEMVGDMLAYWERGYANEREFFDGSAARNQTEFDVTVPELGGRCEVAGECVLQWWWYGKGARQTYESCVDFVIVPHDDGSRGNGLVVRPSRWRRWTGDLLLGR